MKKVSSLVLALVLAVCLAVPAFAATTSKTNTVEVTKEPEPAAEETEEPKEELYNGLEIEGNVNSTSPAGEAILSNLGQTLQNVGVTVAANQTCSIAMLMDLDGDPGWYTFNVPTAASSDKVVVLHWNGGSWEKVGEGYGNTVSAYFGHFSPVAIVVIKSNGAAAAAGTGALKAPQTGDSMAIPFAALAVMALAGVVAVKARKKEM